jgi:hypothetical protein
VLEVAAAISLMLLEIENLEILNLLYKFLHQKVE